MVRYLGMDVHREFAQIAVVENGLVRDEGRIGVTPEALRRWAEELRPDDQVALEATGNSDAIANLLTPRVARVVVSNPSKTRAIAEAKVKTDKVDARILAQLLAADFLPPVWLPDERTRSLRRQVMRRAHVVRQRTRIKNQVQAILARNLVPTPPVSDLFGRTGRHWLSRQELPADERATVAALLRQLDFHGEELAIVDKELAIEALGDPMVAHLMTIPGIDAIAGISIVAAVGDFFRFDDPDKLVAYVGLNPRVRQSGNSAPVHGRISKTGRAHVRGVLVEAAWSASRAPGPLRAFYQRVNARRGFQKAIVATARKMLVLAWHLVTKDQDYAFARPALVTHKRRKLELAAGAPSRRGNYRLPGAAYNNKQRRHEERLAVEKAEHAYEVLVAHWQPKRPTPAGQSRFNATDTDDGGRRRQQWDATSKP
jgi:transposase